MRVRLNFVLQHAVMKDKQRQLQTVGYAYLVKDRPHLGCGSTPRRSQYEQHSSIT